MAQLDPSIILQAGKGVTPLETPMQAMGGALQLQQLMNQNKQSNIQTQMLQQQFEDANRIRQTIAQAGSQPGDRMDNITKALQQDGSPTAMKYLENITTMGKNMAELDSSKLKNVKEHLTMVGNDIGAAKSPQEAASTIIRHAQTGGIPPAQAQELLGDLQNIGDPQSFQTWQGLQAAKLGATKELLDRITPQTKVEGPNAVTTKGGQLVGVTPIPGVAASEPAKELQDYNASLAQQGKKPVTLDDPGFLAWHNKMHPNMATVMGNAGLTPEALNMLATFGAQKGEVPKVGMGMTGTGIQTQIANKMAQLSPDLAGAGAIYKANQASLTSIQKQRDAVVNFENTALKNLSVFENLAKNLVDTGSPLLNQPIRYLAAQAAGSPGQAAANAALQTVIPEFAKINSGQMGNGALSDSARHEVANILPASATLGQILAVAKVLRQDAANRHSSLDETLADISGRMKGGQQPANKPVSSGLTNLHTNGKQTIGWDGSKWVDTQTGQEVK